jgi:general secretion pathway protein G
MKSQQGFTLIELLIVVAIIALIATLAMPNIRDAMQKAKRTASMTDMKTISKAIQAYDLEWDTYPIASVSPISVLRPLLEPKYVTELNILDSWSNEYIYEGGPDGFTIISYGRDGVPSGPTEGKIEDFNHDIRLINGKFVTKP